MHWNQQCQISHFPGEPPLNDSKNHTVLPLPSVIHAVSIPMWQLVMQYLYFGGTDALHIRNTDVMEVIKPVPIQMSHFVQILHLSLLYYNKKKQKTNIKLPSKTIFSAPVCSQVLPAGGAAEALWDHLLQEHKHRDMRGDLQPHQGAKIDQNVKFHCNW